VGDIVQFSYNWDRMQQGLPVKFFTEYRILGDDVVIFNEKVAQRYKFLITEVFNININIQKSVIGDARNCQIEFTKRLALNGKEISSIKRNILTKNSIVNMLDLIDILIERDFISPDTGHHDLCPILGQEEETLFNLMVWVRSSRTPTFESGGNVTFKITRDAFNQKLKEKRSQNIMEKTALIDKYLTAALPLDEYYKKNSVPYDEKALGLGRYESDNLKLHPLVWAINQTGMDLSIALSMIWDDESADMAPVEYLPIISNESYFHTPRKQSMEYLSKLIISVFNELRDESQTIKNIDI
jgi:hypothetical protein